MRSRPSHGPGLGLLPECTAMLYHLGDVSLVEISTGEFAEPIDDRFVLRTRSAGRVTPFFVATALSSFRPSPGRLPSSRQNP
jgi:hypothetical protein